MRTTIAIVRGVLFAVGIFTMMKYWEEANLWQYPTRFTRPAIGGVLTVYILVLCQVSAWLEDWWERRR